MLFDYTCLEVVILFFLISLFFRERTARAIAVYVFPEPAGPIANSISFFSYSCTSFNWFSLRGTIGFPVTLNTIVSPVFSIWGERPFTMSKITSSFSELYWAQCFSNANIFSSKAEFELGFADKFDTVIVNDDLEKAKAEALKVIRNFIEQ